MKYIIIISVLVFSLSCKAKKVALKKKSVTHCPAFKFDHGGHSIKVGER